MPRDDQLQVESEFRFLILNGFKTNFIILASRGTTLPDTLMYHFTLELPAIVSDMHECGVLHADIKADNIMLREPSLLI